MSGNAAALRSSTSITLANSLVGNAEHCWLPLRGGLVCAPALFAMLASGLMLSHKASGHARICH